MRDLSGKAILITGGGGALGNAIIDRLAADGADLVVNDYNPEAAERACGLARSRGRRAIPIGGDVTEEVDVAAMVEKTVSEFGKLDVVIANAGLHTTTWLVETTRAEFDRINSVNNWGVFLTDREAAKQMIKQGHGKIINAASISGKRTTPLQSVYHASKFAVVGITRAVATELAPHGITCNAYCPGMVDSPMWDHLAGERSDRLGIPVDEVRRQSLEKIPLGRMQKPSEVAAAVSFLASPDSDYMTGQALNICGGIFMS
ncbi:MAG: glucose 1-dehydrogenase [Chloroflexota bacterium]|nr:glucose 1-dehydrogenase [Chloroflexota bacterium]